MILGCNSLGEGGMSDLGGVGVGEDGVVDLELGRAYDMARGGVCDLVEGVGGYIVYDPERGRAYNVVGGGVDDLGRDGVPVYDLERDRPKDLAGGVADLAGDGPDQGPNEVNNLLRSGCVERGGASEGLVLPVLFRRR